MQNNFAAFRHRFRQYVSTFVNDDGKMAVPVEQKLLHTEEVCLITEQLSEKEQIPELNRFRFAVCALFHDLSRFEQYTRVRTFKDADSFDHGDKSAELMLSGGFIAELPDNEKVLIADAIRAHNKLTIPSNLTGDTLAAAKMVRDADKLSILGIIYRYLTGQIPNDPTMKLDLPETDAYSPSIFQAVIDGEPVKYTDLRSMNDFLLILCTWTADLNYRAARLYAAEHGLYDKLLSLLPSDENTRRLPGLIRERLTGDAK